ncbi:MAG TPA: bifunctional phosphoribosylaminoimidazolecarboxamide formyltransferase/IMP cyclohydrolase [Candidatus Nanopelagicales bacterium]|nr:bifunctional phosphoribosylaminoimidazolecarboxamide formyltransferase/IMP cyclohydrolase [Candidatus Nanopelagicales bacterium]
MNDPQQRIPVRRALVSVYDKTGLAELARGLHQAGVEIVSTGSTASVIADAGVPVTPVGEVTGFPEALDGRVKTLHPGIHGGLLADLRKDDHRRQLEDLGIAPFELVVVNLYPFTQTVASGATPHECIEQIDIGGPAMVRASAKNFANVAVVVSAEKYPTVLEAVAGGGFTEAQRAELAAAAFAHTATYDISVATWMASEAVDTDEEFPQWLGAAWTRGDILRYGENPHQSAAVYIAHTHEPGIASAEQLHGKQMSYNNFVDADAARRAAFDFVDPAVAIIKHANPCGLAVGMDAEEAYRKAFATDPVSAFGGVVAVNRPVSQELVEAMADVFTEVIVAPDFDDDALALLQLKKNVRILRVAGPHPGRRQEGRTISGGMLVQSIDDVSAPGDESGAWQCVAGDPVDAATLRDLQFAWTACRSVKSNAILLAREGAAVGIGMGQVNRVDSARLAVERAGERAVGSVAASDAFFPFADGLQVLIDGGIRAVVQPGGSVRDDEVIAAAHEAGISMYVTGTRHFFH